MTKPIVLVAAAALIDVDGRVLICQRPQGKQLAGLWEFPGGKVEAGELPEAALVRELEEELGVALDPAALAPATFASAPLGEGARHLLLLLYCARSWTGTPEPRHASALKWATTVELRTLPMPPADIPLIPLIEALVPPTPSSSA